MAALPEPLFLDPSSAPVPLFQAQAERAGLSHSSNKHQQEAGGFCGVTPHHPAPSRHGRRCKPR